jgi:RNA polymerase sigma-70 factor (ECF subfamily)
MKHMQEREKEFLESYDLYVDELFRFAYFKVSQQEVAEDIVQDVFIDTWQYLVNDNKIENIRAFLYRAVRNKIINHYRKKKTGSLDRLFEEGFDVSDEKSGQDAIYMNVEKNHLLHLLEKVDQKYREPVILRHVEGLDIKEIAEIVSETENNVSVMIHRGMEQLKKLAHI